MMLTPKENAKTIINPRRASMLVARCFSQVDLSFSIGRSPAGGELIISEPDMRSPLSQAA